MNAFNPELCVARKTKQEHYDLNMARLYHQIAFNLQRPNKTLSKLELCNQLKLHYANGAGPANIQVNNTVKKTQVKKTTKRKECTINKLQKQQNKQKKKVMKNLMKYHKNRNYTYKPIINQLTNISRNPIRKPKYSQIIKNAVQIQFGEKRIENLTDLQRINLNKINEKVLMEAIIEYQNYKNNPNTVIQSISVPRTWKPSIGARNLTIKYEEKEFTCSFKARNKLTLDTLVYVNLEVINNEIQHVYHIKNLLRHMKSKGYCPGQPWKQLTPNNIKKCHPTVLEDLDIKGLLYVRELQKLRNINILINVEKMLSEVHSIRNKFRVVMHAHTNNNIKERRGNCGLAIIQLYDYIQEQKTKAKKVEILKELGESLPVCIEAKCNFIREFVEMKKGGLKFNHNSKISKGSNISNAVLFFMNKWCGEAAKQSNPKEYFMGKLPDLFTRVQALLQNKNASNGKIDYRDIMNFILENGEYMLNCGNVNFENIKLNTEQQKRTVFGMQGIR